MIMSNVKKFSCSNCNEPYEAYPPDDVFTKAMIKKCFVCRYLNRVTIERSVECENCSQQNVIFWHPDYLHTNGEKELAQINRDKSKQISIKDILNEKHPIVRD